MFAFVMRVNLLAAFVITLSGALNGWHSPAQAQSVTDRGLTIDSGAIKFKSTVLQDRVQEAIEHAKQNDLSYINELMDLHKANPDGILSFLEQYKKDGDSNVRFGVIEAASRVNTDKSMAILTSMVEDAEVGHEAVRVLYENNNCSRIVAKGGKRLEGALIRKFISNRYSTHGTLLLACFKENKKIVGLLERRRKTYESVPKRQATDEVITIDLVLIELGKTDAFARVKNSFALRKVENLLAVLRYIKSIQNRTILLQVVELLKDKGNAREIGVAGEPPQFTRLCDEALQALNSKVSLSGQVIYGPPRRYSDQELAKAYERFKKLYGSKAK